MVQAYETKKRASAEQQRSKTKAGQDIGPPADVLDPPRRAEGEASLRRFCECYFPTRFQLAWSPDHLKVLDRFEDAIRHGGLFSLAMPRGSGKTSIAEAASLWATLTGLHAFVMLIAVSHDRADELLQSIKTELLTNDLLYEDFPEVCHPIRCLEDRANRSKGQHINGASTYIGWRKSELVLPTVEGSRASGAVLRVAGLTSGSVRGSKHTRPNDGRSVRPSLAILDDPQSDESSESPSQCQKRLKLLHGAVLGMAGPGARITAIVPCTIITKGDLADSLLDRKISPLWTGQRYQLLYRFPDRMDLWDEYSDRRADELRNDGDGHLATAWYGQQFDAMNAGSLVAWPERFNPDELSALQHAMNLYYLDPESFWCDYQNAPRESKGDLDQLNAESLAVRWSGVDRHVAPLAATRLTAFVDVQKKCLYWLVAAWDEHFGGSVIDYGTFPEQDRQYFSLADVKKTLGKAFPGTGLEGSIHAGLTKCVAYLLGRNWEHQSGTLMRIERLLVDAGWGDTADCVYEWCGQTDYPAIVMPSRGRGIGVGNKPLAEYQKKPGERLGFHWLMSAAEKRLLKKLEIDTNFWKSFVAERLRVALGDKSALTLYGSKGTDHKMLADHWTAEKATEAEEIKSGRRITVWKQLPGRDNHFWDCLVGCAAAASFQGTTLNASGGAQQRQERANSSRAEYEAKRKAFEGRRGY